VSSVKEVILTSEMVDVSEETPIDPVNSLIEQGRSCPSVTDDHRRDLRGGMIESAGQTASDSKTVSVNSRRHRNRPKISHEERLKRVLGTLKHHYPEYNIQVKENITISLDLGDGETVPFQER